MPSGWWIVPAAVIGAIIWAYLILATVEEPTIEPTIEEEIVYECLQYDIKQKAFITKDCDENDNSRE